MADIKKPNRFSGLMQTIRKESEAVSVAPVAPVTPIALPTPPPQAIAPPNPIASPNPIAASSQAEMLWVARAKVHRDLDQDRRYFDETELDNMAASMRSVGMIDPLSVRRRPETADEYDLLAGEKRHRAAEKAELDLVLVRIFKVDDQTADDIKSISNLQRSDLNAWEETAALMKMLMRHLDRSQSEVISLLNQAANEKRGLTSNVVRKEDWMIVEEVFEVAGRLSPESFRKHRLPLLRLPDEVQHVLQQGKLHYTKVNEILKVKDVDLQQQLLQAAIDQELSFDQLQEKVKALRPARTEKPNDLSQRLIALPRQLKQAKVWTDPAKRKKLEKLLTEMERLLEES